MRYVSISSKNIISTLMFRAVFGIHCSFFIILPIWLKTCRFNDFFRRQNVWTQNVECPYMNFLFFLYIKFLCENVVLLQEISCLLGMTNEISRKNSLLDSLILVMACIFTKSKAHYRVFQILRLAFLIILADSFFYHWHVATILSQNCG